MAKRGRKPAPKPKIKRSDLEPVFPWERQPGETIKAFKAFSEYLAAGEDRSLRETCRQIRKHWSQISNWSGKFDWVARAEAKDRYDRKVLNRTNQRAIMEMNDRQAQMAVAASAAAMSTIAKHIKTASNPNPPLLEDRDAIRLLAIATRIERVARGEPDTIMETKADKSMTVDERRVTMVRMLENPKAVEHFSALSRLMGTGDPEDVI